MHDISRLAGSFPPLITPFIDDEIDYGTFEALVEFHIRSGSHGIVVNGTTAEPSTLTIAERNSLVSRAVATAAGRIPVVAATGSQSLAETRALTDHAVRAGADALLIVTPYYVRPPQQGLIAYYRAVVAGYRVPWMLYHIPGRSAVGVTVETIKRLNEESPEFVGMKHAVNDLSFVSECLAFRPGFRIFVGLEELSFPMMAVGAVGLMNAVGNLHPGLLAQLSEAVHAGNITQARALHDSLFELNKALFFETNPTPLKYMMKRLGLLTDNAHRLPMMRATPDLERRLDEVLERSNLTRMTLASP